MKKTAAWILVLVMAFSLFAGCAGDTESTGAGSASGLGDAGDAGGSGGSGSDDGYMAVTLAITEDAKTLFPYGVGGSGRHSVRILLYEKIVYTNSDTHEVENWLAKEITDKGDGVYEVEIYDYITDSLGNNMTASDIVFSFDKAIEDGNAAANLGTLDSYTATGDYTVEFRFNSTAVGVFEQAMNAVYCVTEAAWEASGDEMAATPYGTGCYVLDHYAKDSYYTFVKNENYWQQDPSLRASIAAQNADEITLAVITEATTRSIALENGEIDGTTISVTDIGNFANDDYSPKDGYIVNQAKTGNSFILQYTCAAPSPLADINLRKAISHAIDADAITYMLYGNIGRTLSSVVNDAWLDAGAVEDDPNYFAYDVELAKQYLAESSYNGETLVILGQSTHNEIATMVQAYCEEIGVSVEMMLLEQAIAEEYMLDDEPGRYDIVIQPVSTMFYSWSALGRFNADNYTSGLNRCFINDPELQRLFYNMSDTENYSQQAVADFGKYVEDQCYAYALYSYNSLFVGNADKFVEFGIDPFKNISGSTSLYVQ